MQQVHPFGRLALAVAMLVAAFLPAKLAVVAAVYIVVLSVVAVAGVLPSHLRFVAYVGVPILAALALVWGVAMPNGVQTTRDGLEHAGRSWLRIVACGGALQATFLPLLARPEHLKAFLDKVRMNGAVGILLVASVVFIPEVRRRLALIIDARKAQGHEVGGLSGLRHLPGMLMPLVSSLLDTSLKRAELWAHRDVLRRYQDPSSEDRYSWLATLAATCMAVAAVGIGGLG